MVASKNQLTDGVPRRQALKLLGFGSAAVVLGGAGLLNPAQAFAATGPTVQGGPTLPTGSVSATDTITAATLTTESWQASRGSNYYIAHRGSGDVLPEHSMAAYQAAVAWGAKCLEISVGMTSDGVLICMHDTTYDRTTNVTGRIVDQPSDVLADARILQPRLGDYWVKNAPRIPLFEEVLQKFGGRVILAIEAKVDAAFDPMMAMIEEYGLGNSIIVKSHYASNRWRSAKQAGLPVFCYFGSAAETTAAAVKDAGEDLDPAKDCLVIYGFAGGGLYLPDATVRAAVATGVPVWAFPLHRRVDAQHFFDLGVEGAICSSYGYVAESIKPVTSDSWATQAIAAGQLSKDPSSNSYAAKFTPAGELVLDVRGIQQFSTLGQTGPIANATGSYDIDVDLAWGVLPKNSSDCLSVAFCRGDDSYYQHRGGKGDGYHAILRANGGLGLYRHRDGQITGELLAPALSTPALAAGEVAHLRLEVSAKGVVLTRTDTGHSITADDASERGGYVHLGRSSVDGVAKFANLAIG